MGPLIIDGLKFQERTDGSRKLIVESSKLDACIKYVLDGKIKAITINCFQGYELPDIAFLDRLSNVLEGLHLPETRFDNKVVNTLHRLKFLGFADNKRDVIDLSNFPNLKSLACDYSIRLKGLDTCKNLTSLVLTGYKTKSKDLSQLPFFSELETFYLYKTPILTLNGIERLNNLKKLEIFSASKLESIGALQALSGGLQEIQIERCKKIADYESLGTVKSLKKLFMSESGEIESLGFVKELPNLEFISFWGTNVLDGVLSHCEEIDYVGFDDKRHYSHKFEQFKRTNKKQVF